MSKQKDLDLLIGTGTDRQWWNATGHCGGCGLDTCHPGVGCTAGGDDTCRYCPDRGGDLKPPAPKPDTTPDPNQGELF